MARVTVEDCIEIVPNRFELVTLAASRTRQIASGSALTIERDNDKDAVVSLREIADQTVSVDALKEEVIINNQKYGKVDTIDESTPQIGEEVTDNTANEVAEEINALQSEEGAQAMDAEDLAAEPADLDEELGDEGFGGDEALGFGGDDVVDVED